MTSLTDSLQSPKTRLRMFSSRVLIFSVLIAIALTVFLQIHLPMRDDVAWLLYVAENWLDGGRPYVDFIEVNPPTVIWISMLPALIARGLGISALMMTPVFFTALVTACAGLTVHLLHARGIFRDRAATLTVLVVTLLLLTLSEFGQREHLIVAMALPFLVQHAGRPPESRAAAWQDIVAGLLVGLCCGIKPHYVIAFAVVCVVTALFGRRQPWLAIATAACTVISIAAAMFVFTPDYLDHIVPLAVVLYKPFAHGRLLPLSSLPLLLTSLAIAALWRLHARRLDDGGAMGVLLTFALGCWIVYFIQEKGWVYHRLPAMVATVLALLVWIAKMPRSWAFGSRIVGCRSMRIIIGVLMLGLTAHAAIRAVKVTAAAAMPDRSPEAHMADYLRKSGVSSYMAFTGFLHWGFPMVQVTGVAWASRFPSTWALQVEHVRTMAPLHTSDTAMSVPAGGIRDGMVRDWMVQDFLATCPEVVAVANSEGIDYLRVLAGGGTGFSDAWTHYQAVAVIGDFSVYAWRPGSMRDSVCRRGTKTSSLSVHDAVAGVFSVI